MLEVGALRAGYGAIEILRGVDLTVAAGEIVALLGSNGAGKSTLNNNLSGLYRPFGGQVRFEGNDITGARSTRIVEAGLVQVPEGRRIFPNLSVRENLELGSYRRGRASRQKNLDYVVTVFPRLKERWTQH
ncbi:MAG TPA: ATP-binding cassette domain-containing protein, partial [Reyranella sp.]